MDMYILYFVGMGYGLKRPWMVVHFCVDLLDL
jgi:hypothetical protein